MTPIIDKSDIQIVEADEKHASLLRDMGEQTFREAYSNDPDTANMELYIAQNFQLERMVADLQNPQAKFLLVKYNEQWAGYALFRWDRTHELLHNTKSLMLHRIYVLQSFWRHQIGSVLLQYILDFAKSGGYEYMWLIVWEENHRALRFYKKWGFEHFGYEKFQYGANVTDDWVLRKRL